MILHDTLVMLTAAEFDELPEYSCSLPTGTTIGKKWKRKKVYTDESKGWLMGEYIPDADPKMVRIRWREVVIWQGYESIEDLMYNPDPIKEIEHGGFNEHHRTA